MGKLLQKPTYAHAAIHDYIVSEVLNFGVELRQHNEYDWRKDTPYFDDKSRTFIIQVTQGDGYLWSCCYVSMSDIAKCLGIDNHYSDLPTKTEGGYILGDYDSSSNNDDSTYPKGWCHVFKFTTVSHSGVIRYSQIAYSHLHKRLVLREDVCYNLPDTHTARAKRDMYMGFSDYKRPQHRYHSVLFLRNCFGSLSLRNAFAVGCNPKNNPKSEIIKI